GFGHDQALGVDRLPFVLIGILSVADRTAQHFLKHPSAAMRLVLEQVERLVGKLTSHQIGQRSHFASTDPSVFVNGRECHSDNPNSYIFLRRNLRQTNYFLPRPECPRKVRVGANSPSLCPTMSSETLTFTCCRPLWTMKVTPTNSGTIVQRRAQVVIGSCDPDS